MSKSFVCRRHPAATAVMMEVIDHCRRSVTKADKKHGRQGVRTLQASLTLAAMYYVAGEHEKAEPLLKGYLSAAKRKPALDPRETAWAISILAEVYFRMDRPLDAMLITNEAKPMCGSMNLSRNDPLLNALLDLTFSLGAGKDPESRLRGFAAALVTPCWCVSYGLHRTSADAQSMSKLHSFFASYGIDDEMWEWAVKHANLTRYDFLGLLSVLLHSSGLLSRPFEHLLNQKVRVIHLR